MMWIPYIIFQNTDDDEAVKVDAQTEDGTMRTKQYGEHWLPLILGVSCKLGGPPPNMRGRF